MYFVRTMIDCHCRNVKILLSSVLFYARPYVFTFYVTVCECHIALKAT